MKTKYLLIVLGIIMLITPLTLLSVNGQEVTSYPVSYTEEGKKIKEDKNGKFIIKFKDDISQEKKEKFLQEKNLKGRKVGKEKVSPKVVVSDFEINLLDSEIIEYIEPDHKLETQAEEFNDFLYKDQWYLKALGYSNSTNTPENKVIAVIDTGVCTNHPDLQDKVLDGWNFVDNNSDTADTSGHGCAISGIIVANSNNNQGIVGLTSNTKILPLKVIDNQGVGSYSNLIQAIDYAIEKKVNLINISLGGLSDSKILHDSIKKAVDLGIQVVASAGNTGNSEIMYPAKYQEVISVGSVDNDYLVSSFSSTSQDIDAWAYGNRVISTDKNGGYTKVNGTSIATAMVSGFLANDVQLKQKGIINFSKITNFPIFLTSIKKQFESNSRLSFDVPESLYVYEFQNLSANKDTLINWERNIKVSRTEQLVITVRTRNSSKEASKLKSSLMERDNCNQELCLINNENSSKEYAIFTAFIQEKESIITIKYNIDDFVGYKLFKSILSSIRINNKPININNYLRIIEDALSIDSRIMPQVQSCGGITDSNPNDFPCCSSSDSPNGDYNNANCTWYAQYKRPDLHGIVSGNAGAWYQQAKDHNIVVSSSPSVGAIVVWTGHVAYIESVNTQTSQMTWSEQNCLTYWTDSSGNKNYGVNAYNSSVTRSYPNSYGGTLIGYIPIQSGSASCSGSNPVMTNWNISTSLTCNPSGSLTIMPTSSISPTGSNVLTITPF